MQDMEVVINKEIMKLKFEEKDFTQLGRNKYVRWNYFGRGKGQGHLFLDLFTSLDIGKNYHLYI
jgi:hypothetical protein